MNNKGVGLLLIIVIVAITTLVSVTAYNLFIQPSISKIFMSKEEKSDNLPSLETQPTSTTQPTPSPTQPQSIPATATTPLTRTPTNPTTQPNTQITRPTTQPQKSVTPTKPKVTLTQPYRAVVERSSNIIEKRIFLLSYEPTHPTSGPLISYYKWVRPETISDWLIKIIRDYTASLVKYRVSEHKIISDFPTKIDGYKYNLNDYFACMTDTSKCHNPDNADFAKILSENNICEKFNRNEFDELWIFGGDNFGLDIFRFAGPKGFYGTSPVIEGTSCNKPLPIMGFNYEASYTPALANMIRRSESILREVFKVTEEGGVGSWHTYSKDSKLNPYFVKDGNFFYRFTNSGRSIDESRKDLVGIAGCGYSGGTPTTSNSSLGFDNKRKVLSNCDEFQSFPYINNIPKEITCSVWGCTEYGFYYYWLMNIPKNKCFYNISWNEPVREGNNYVNKVITRPIKCNWLEYIFDFSWR